MATSRQLVNYLCIISSNNDCYSKDTHSEKAPLNKTPGLKYEHGHLLVTSNQLFIINFYTETKFSKNLPFVLPILFILTLSSDRAVL